MSNQNTSRELASPETQWRALRHPRTALWCGALAALLLHTAIGRAAPIPEWEKIFTLDGQEEPFCIRATSDGGYIVVGDIDRTAVGNDSDICAIKTFANGSVEWQQTYGGSGRDWAWHHCVQETTDGGYVIAGRNTSRDPRPPDLRGLNCVVFRAGA